MPLHIVINIFPKPPVRHQFICGKVLVENNATLVHSLTVAVITILREDRFNVAFKRITRFAGWDDEDHSNRKASKRDRSESNLTMTLRVQGGDEKSLSSTLPHITAKDAITAPHQPRPCRHANKKTLKRKISISN